MGSTKGSICSSKIQDMQCIIDQLEISDLLTRYAVALDSRNWSLLETCFTPDAEVDYGPEGGQHVGFPEILATVRQFLDGLDSSQHLTGNYQIQVEGNEAFCTSYVHAQHYLKGAEGGDTYTLGGGYVDKVVRTDKGWRLSKRRLDTWWIQGNTTIFEQLAKSKE